MKLATVIFNLNKEGHHVVRENVTPAELALLVAEHHVNSGGKPLDVDEKGDFINKSVVETGDTSKRVTVKDGKEVTETVPVRTAIEEKGRLMQRYAANKVNAMYPGGSPNLPSDFKSAYKLGLQTALPASKLTEVKII